MNLQRNGDVHGEERAGNSTLLLKQGSHEPKRRRGWLSIVFIGWWLEILAMICVLGMFAGLVATLRLYDRRALGDWPLSISINALISVESVIMKVAMIVVIAQGMFMSMVIVSTIIELTSSFPGLGQLKWTWFSRNRPMRDLATFDASTRGPYGATKLLWTVGPRY
jgi:hypothetical protein